MTDQNYASSLQRIKSVAELRIAQNALQDNAAIHVFIDDALGDLVVQLEAWVWARSLQKQEVTYPTGWWDALKAAVFPVWAKRRWPPKYTTITLEASAFYPTFKYDIPKHSAEIAIMKYPSEEWGAEWSEE